MRVVFFVVLDWRVPFGLLMWADVFQHVSIKQQIRFFVCGEWMVHRVKSVVGVVFLVLLDWFVPFRGLLMGKPLL